MVGHGLRRVFDSTASNGYDKAAQKQSPAPAAHVSHAFTTATTDAVVQILSMLTCAVRFGVPAVSLIAGLTRGVERATRHAGSRRGPSACTTIRSYDERQMPPADLCLAHLLWLLTDEEAFLDGGQYDAYSSEHVEWGLAAATECGAAGTRGTGAEPRDRTMSDTIIEQIAGPHSKLPFHRDNADMLRDAEGNRIALFIEDNVAGNAAFVVRACNTHDTLLALARDLVADYERGFTQRGRLGEIVARAKEALAALEPAERAAQ